MTVEYIDSMGSDLSVVRAARVSFANDSEIGWVCVMAHDGVTEYTPPKNADPSELFLSLKDIRLIKYLAKHNHWTPFAHTAITFRVSAPVPIRTQCFKHKQGFTENEESRRYISHKPVIFIPDEFRMAPTNGAKQGSEGVHPESDEWRRIYIEAVDASVTIYELMIEAGICPEQARFVLPQGCIVNWYWTGSLAAYARFYKLRSDPHAQKEVRDIAELISPKLRELFPVSWNELTK